MQNKTNIWSLLLFSGLIIILFKNKTYWLESDEFFELDLGLEDDDDTGVEGESREFLFRLWEYPLLIIKLQFKMSKIFCPLLDIVLMAGDGF